MVSFPNDNSLTHNAHRTHWPGNYSRSYRRRIQGQSRPLLNVLPKQAQFWKLPYAISSDTKQEYDASRELRSGKHDNETVTLLYRLANHMEQPWISIARARLKLVLKFRNASVPRFNKPLKLPFLQDCPPSA